MAGQLHAANKKALKQAALEVNILFVGVNGNTASGPYTPVQSGTWYGYRMFLRRVEAWTFVENKGGGEARPLEATVLSATSHAVVLSSLVQLRR